MKTFYWLVKREFWEHRGGFLWAPVITALVILALNIMGIITAEVFRSRANVHVQGIDFNALSQHMDANAMQALGNALDMVMMAPAFLIGFVLFVVVFFYCIHTLWNDRRDRSLLFWKSLPISDVTTVLSKVFCATLLAPAIAIIVSVAIGWFSLALVAMTGAFHGLNLWDMLWTLPHPFHFTAVMLATLPIYLLWALPCVGWLMLCSAAARGKPTLWAIALPVGAGILVSWFNIMNLFSLSSLWYWQHIAGRALLSVVPGSWVVAGNGGLLHLAGGFAAGQAAGEAAGQSASTHLIDSIFNLRGNYDMVISAPFLIGIAAGIVLLAATIWVRRSRTDM